MDIRTIVWMAFVMNAAKIIVIYLISKFNPSYRGTQLWFYGSIFVASGLVLSLLRTMPEFTEFPLPLITIVAIFGDMLTYIGILRFFDRPENIKLLTTIAALPVLLCLYFTFMHDHEMSILAVNSAALGTIAFLSAFEVLRIRMSASIRSICRFIGLIFLAYGIFLAWRTMMLVLTIAGIDQINVQSLQKDAFLATSAFGYMTIPALILLIAQRSNTERHHLEERFHLIFEMIPDAVMIFSIAKGVIVEVNDKFTDMTGYSKEEVLGKSMASLPLWPNLDERRTYLQFLLKQRRSERTETTLRKKDGSLLTALLSSQIVDINGSMHLISVAHDISDRLNMEEVLRRSEEKFKAIANYNANLEAWIGINGKLLWVSPSLEKFTGHSPENFIEKFDFLVRLIHKNDVSRIQSVIRRGLSREESSGENIEFRYVKPDGTTGWMSMNWTAIFNMDNVFNGIRVSGRDITEAKLANEQIKILSQAVEQSPASILITDVMGTINYANRKAVESTGYDLAEIIGNKPSLFKSGKQSVAFYRNLWTTVRSGKEWKGEFLNKKKNGDLYWESGSISPIYNDRDEIGWVLAIKEDITERKRLEQELLVQARTDVMTGIANRRYFMEVVDKKLAMLNRHSQPSAILLLDIDHFKLINDTFGHAIGDEAIKAFVRACVEVLDPSCFFGRIGGEEFSVFLEDIGLSEALAMAENLRAHIETVGLRNDEGTLISFTVSIGVAAATSGCRLQELLGIADQALYQAKNEGRNRVVASRSKEFIRIDRG